MAVAIELKNIVPRWLRPYYYYLFHLLGRFFLKVPIRSSLVMFFWVIRCRKGISRFLVFKFYRDWVQHARISPTLVDFAYALALSRRKENTKVCVCFDPGSRARLVLVYTRAGARPAYTDAHCAA